MSPADQPEKRKALIEEGFCVFESILNEEMLSRVTCASNRLLDAQDKEHFEKQKSTGSLICVYDDPFFADLVGWQPALDALNSLGYVAPKFSTGFVISKPPHSPPLFWHQDWWGWEHPHSYTPNPQQIFLMYYLVDTTPKNGCLRLIPGSHLHRHPLHDISEAHTEEIRLAEDVTSPAYLDHPDEMDVCVKAGDVVMGDSRLLHSAHANRTEERRTVITLWYHPIYDELPEPMQAQLGKRNAEAPSKNYPPTGVRTWPQNAQERIRDLIPLYTGDKSPLNWNRTPGPQLK